MNLTTWEIGEFKELLISRKLLEIELNRCHFRRLCFFEVFGAEIHFFDQHFFSQISRQNFRFLVFEFYSTYFDSHPQLDIKFNPIKHMKSDTFSMIFQIYPESI